METNNNFLIICTCGIKMNVINKESIFEHISSIHHRNYIEKNKHLSPGERINNMKNIQKRYNTNYFIKHRDVLLKKEKCEICDGSYDKTHRSRHFKTKKHLVKMVSLA